MSDVKNGLKLPNKGLMVNNRLGELLVHLGLGDFMDRQVQGQLRTEVVIQGPRGDADLSGDVAIRGDFVPVNREHFAGDHQNSLFSLDRAGISRAPEPFHDWFCLLRRCHAVSITDGYK